MSEQLRRQSQVFVHTTTVLTLRVYITFTARSSNIRRITRKLPLAAPEIGAQQECWRPAVRNLLQKKFSLQQQFWIFAARIILKMRKKFAMSAMCSLFIVYIPPMNTHATHNIPHSNPNPADSAWRRFHINWSRGLPAPLTIADDIVISQQVLEPRRIF